MIKTQQGYISHNVEEQGVHGRRNRMMKELKSYAPEEIRIHSITGVDKEIFATRFILLPFHHTPKNIEAKLSFKGPLLLTSAMIPDVTIPFIIIYNLKEGDEITFSYRLNTGVSVQHAKFQKFIYRPKMNYAARFDFPVDVYSSEEIDKFLYS